MPFWHGDQAGRPLEFGRRIGALVRELREMPRSVAIARADDASTIWIRRRRRMCCAIWWTRSWQRWWCRMIATIVIERVRDELGDWRVCVLTPFGSRVHAPWAMAATAKTASDVRASTWRRCGARMDSCCAFRRRMTPPAVDAILLEPEEAAELVLRQLGSTALFAAKFRESCGAGAAVAATTGGRADSAVAAAKAGLRPVERGEPVCELSDSAGGLSRVPARCVRYAGVDGDAAWRLASRSLRVHTVDSRTPSPFARALLFSYVANYIYDGDAPLAERRAQALSIDQDQLRELMGDADLRELLDVECD